MRCKRMYVNTLLPLAGRLIKHTTAAADWSVRLQRICRSQCDYYLIQFLFRQALHKFSGIKCYSIIRIAYDCPCLYTSTPHITQITPSSGVSDPEETLTKSDCLSKYIFYFLFLESDLALATPTSHGLGISICPKYPWELDTDCFDC